MGKKAQTWYENLKQVGIKHDTADWLCGEIVKRTFAPNSNAEREAVMLDTGITSYVLHRTGGPQFKDDVLDKMVGKRVCCKGVLDGTTFVASQFRPEETAADDTSSLVKMERETPKQISKFKVGDKVRQRKRGLAFSQINGVVKSIDGDKMEVQWEGIDQPEKFNLSDTVALHSMLEKI